MAITPATPQKRKPDGNVTKKDPEMDEKLFAESPGYTEGVASQHLVPTADGREVDETGQLVASNEKHAEESEGNVSEAGEFRAIIIAMYVPAVIILQSPQTDQYKFGSR